MSLRFLQLLDDTGMHYRTVPAGYVDGYGFGDRLLEGVAFRMEVSPDGKLMATVAPNAKTYMASLNEQKWLAEALKYAAQNDAFATDATLRDDSVVLFDAAKPHAQQLFWCPGTIMVDGQPIVSPDAAASVTAAR